MRRWKGDICFALAAVLFVIAALQFFSAKYRTGPEEINLALYGFVPEYESFEEIVRECWSEKHPDVQLNIVEWDCYREELPDDIDVFVIDITYLDSFADKGYLLPIPEDKITDRDDLIPSFFEGCRVDGTVYVIPQFLCTEILYTRKTDPELKYIDNIPDLYEALGGSGLLTDAGSPFTRICLYLQAVTDEGQRYRDSYPAIEEGNLSPEAEESISLIGKMREKDPDIESQGGGSYYYAGKFAGGMGKAYIGFAEAMHAMGEAAPDMDLRLFSMTDDENIPVFYIDAAAVNSRIPEEKKELAFDLLNMITGRELLVRASENSGDPLYLLTGRYSVYDELSASYPVYAVLKDIVQVPEAQVFRIKPDGDAYVDDARENTDSLPEI